MPPPVTGSRNLHSGPTFEFAADRVRVALAGAGARLVVSGAAMSSPSSSRAACRCLAVGGGIAVPTVLGNAATYVGAGIGGLMGRA
jgi:allophanate hydrolase subunit 2